MIDNSLIIPIDDDRSINFIENIWHYLSPFSAHQIEIYGEKFATVEHAYHWAKFEPCEERELVKETGSPLECLMLSRKFAKNKDLLKADFDKFAVMEEIFRAKLAQHPYLVEVLKLSGDRGLLKEVPSDYYWGIGHDGSGENAMGKLWMKLREEIK